MIKENKYNVCKYLGLLLGAVVLVVIGYVLPPIQGLNAQAQKTMGIFLCLLVLWLFKSLPFGITSVLALVLMPLLSVTSFEFALSKFMSPSTFLIISSCTFSLAFSKTNLAIRLLKRIVSLLGKNTYSIVLSIMLTTCILSSFTSNIPVVTVMTSIALVLLKQLNCEPYKSKLGKVIMLGVTIAAIVGGYITPLGSANNLIAIDLFYQITGQKISFFDWVALGFPIGCALLFVSWAMLIIFFKPEKIRPECIESLLENYRINSKFSKKEKIALGIVISTIILWIANNLMQTNISMILISIISMAIFFLPGINVFSWDEFTSSISWDVILTVGSVISLGNIAIETGLAKWIMNIFIDNCYELPVILFLIIVATFLNFLHILIPISASIVTITLPVLLQAAEVLGINSISIVFIVAVMSGCVLLLPLDPVPMITYSQKYYTLKDLFTIGVVLGGLWSIIISLFSLILL